MIDLELEQTGKKTASIKLIGVGGAGGNTVNSIIKGGCQNIEFIAANTDSQALDQSQADHKIQIGIKATKGLGTGTDPELGRRSAEEDLDKILKAVGDADIVFLSAGMGKGTGSGALPVIAHALKEQGILTIAVVTKPFTFEGKRRADVAHTAIESLRKEVDAIIIISNQKLLDIVGDSMPMTEAFSMINDVLSQSITGISDIITKPGHINVDFADVRAIIKDTGLAIMGIGKASGAHRAREAALMAITSPILENMDIEGAQGVVLNITGGKNLGLHEISDAASVIYAKADENANIIIGSVIDEAMTDQVCVTVIATGFTRPQKEVAQQKQQIVTQPVAQPIAAQQVEVVVVQAAPVQEIVPVAAPVHVAQPAPQQEQKLQGSRLDTEHAEPEQQVVELKKENDFEEQFLREFEQELAAEQPKKSVIEKRHEERIVVEQHVDMSDLDVPAFLRKKNQSQLQE